MYADTGEGEKVDQLTWHGDWGNKEKREDVTKRGERSRGYTSRALPNMV